MVYTLQKQQTCDVSPENTAIHKQQQCDDLQETL